MINRLFLLLVVFVIGCSGSQYVQQPGCKQLDATIYYWDDENDVWLMNQGPTIDRSWAQNRVGYYMSQKKVKTYTETSPNGNKFKFEVFCFEYDYSY